MRLICQPWAAPAPSAVSEAWSDWRKRLIKCEALDGRQKPPREIVELCTLKTLPIFSKFYRQGRKKTPKPPEEVSVPMVTQEMCISARVSVELTVRDSRLLLSPCRYTWPSLYLTHGWRRFSENFKIKHPSFLLFTHTVLQVQAPLSLYRTLK